MQRTVKGGVVQIGGQAWTSPELVALGAGRVDVLLAGDGKAQACIGGGPAFDLQPAFDAGTEAAADLQQAAVQPAISPPEPAAAYEATTPAAEAPRANGTPVATAGGALQAAVGDRLPLVVGRALALGELSEDRGHVLHVRERREVMVQLTPDELAEVAKEQATTFDAYLRAKIEEDERHKAAMRPVKRLLAEVEELSAVHSSGRQKQELDLETWCDFGEQKRVTVRTDTMQIVEVGPLEPGDRQPPLPLRVVHDAGRDAPAGEVISYTWTPAPVASAPRDADAARSDLVAWLHNQGEAACELWALADPAHRLKVVRKLADGDLAGHEAALAELAKLEARAPATDLETPSEGQGLAAARAAIVRWLSGQDEADGVTWQNAPASHRLEASRLLAAGEVADPAEAFEALCAMGQGDEDKADYYAVDVDDDGNIVDGDDFDDESA